MWDGVIEILVTQVSFDSMKKTLSNFIATIRGFQAFDFDHGASRTHPDDDGVVQDPAANRALRASHQGAVSPQAGSHLGPDPAPEGMWIGWW